MHHWNTKFRDDGSTHEDYIVIRHPLSQATNSDVFGIKFCGGYAVLKKNSKDYYKIRKIPVFRKVKEFPLSFLKDAGFRSRDIQMIFGRTIYVHFMASLGLDVAGKPLPKVEDQVEEPVVETAPEPAQKTAEMPIEEMETAEIIAELEAATEAEIPAEKVSEAKEEQPAVEAKPKKKRRRRKKKAALEVIDKLEEKATEE